MWCPTVIPEWVGTVAYRYQERMVGIHMVPGTSCCIVCTGSAVLLVVSNNIWRGCFHRYSWYQPNVKYPIPVVRSTTFHAWSLHVYPYTCIWHAVLFNKYTGTPACVYGRSHNLGSFLAPLFSLPSIELNWIEWKYDVQHESSSSSSAHGYLHLFVFHCQNYCEHLAAPLRWNCVSSNYSRPPQAKRQTELCYSIQYGLGIIQFLHGWCHWDLLLEKGPYNEG